LTVVGDPNVAEGADPINCLCTLRTSAPAARHHSHDRVRWHNGCSPLYSGPEPHL